MNEIIDAMMKFYETSYTIVCIAVVAIIIVLIFWAEYEIEYRIEVKKHGHRKP